MSNTNTVTALEKRVGYKLKTLTLGQDGGLVAAFAVGSIDDKGNFKPMAEKNYVLAPQDAEPILASEAKSGTIRAQLVGALVAALSQRADWLA